MIKLKYVGVGRQYVAGYPRRDIEVDDPVKAAWLVLTKCYAYADESDEAVDEDNTSAKNGTGADNE